METQSNAKTTEIVLEKIIDAITDGRNVLLHGSAGMGKSWLIKHTVPRLRELGMKVYITATTGIAAYALSDPELKIVGTTLHRFAGIGTGELSPHALVSKMFSGAKTNWRKCNVLIIDEISMMGKGLFDKICAVAQIVRNNTSPFAGIQLIVSGDFLQLNPVKDDWVFKSENWDKLKFRPFVLETPYRFADPDFSSMLLRIRKGQHTPDDIKILRQRVRANQSMQKLLETLKDHNPADLIKPTMFYSRRADVDAYNQEKLDALPGEPVEFICKDEHIISSQKDCDHMTPDDFARIMDDDLPRNLYFKVGSQVMLRINLSPEEGLVNGSRGVVTEIVPKEALVVKFLSGKIMRVDVHKRTIENKKFSASRTQIPFILADAMTIHKAQGCTLDYCVASLGNTIFAEGQAYVALSRCRTLKGLFLSEFTSSSIMTNKEALAYSEKIERLAKEEDSK